MKKSSGTERERKKPCHRTKKGGGQIKPHLLKCFINCKYRLKGKIFNYNKFNMPFTVIRNIAVNINVVGICTYICIGCDFKNKIYLSKRNQP